MMDSWEVEWEVQKFFEFQNPWVIRDNLHPHPIWQYHKQRSPHEKTGVQMEWKLHTDKNYFQPFQDFSELIQD